jgi:cysteine desulfurase
VPKIYFDHAATTPISSVALAAYVEQLQELGNPSSLHLYGRAVRKSLEDSREKLARAIDADPSEIIFTGSGTEANNLAIKGLYWQRRAEEPARNLIVISSFEHHAVLDPAIWLQEHEAGQIIELPVTAEGVVNIESAREIITANHQKIALISVMHSNNEVGTLQPIKEIVEIAQPFAIPVHTDAVQSLGKVPLSFNELGVLAMTLSAHKIGGPIGIGALVLKRGIDLTPLLHGGGQEREIRSGTLNAPAIVAFAEAAHSAVNDRYENFIKVSALREELISIVESEVPGSILNGVRSGEILPGIANITFPDTESDALLLLFDGEGIACSTGSACSAGVQQASYVLLAMGKGEKSARSSLRFSLAPSNTSAELDYLRRCLRQVVDRAQSAYKGKT